MHRRDFLKIAAISSLALAFPVWKLAELALAPVEVEYNGRIYRGLRDGDIHISEDQGQSWRKQTGFGAECPIAKFFTSADGRLFAQLKYQGHSFELFLSEDGGRWMVG